MNTELIQDAKRLREKMEWLIAAVSTDKSRNQASSIQVKLDVFGGICSSFETLVRDERTQLETFGADLEAREVAVRNREAAVENSRALLMDRQIAVNAARDAHVIIGTALMERASELEAGEQVLNRDLESLERREAEVEAAQSILQKERRDLDVEKSCIQNAKVNLEDDMKSLTLTTDCTLSELRKAWKRDVQGHYEKAESLSRELESANGRIGGLLSELEAAKGDVIAANKREDEAKSTLETSRQESESQLEHAQEAMRAAQRRGDNLANITRKLEEAKVSIHSQLSTATKKLKDLEAKHAESEAARAMLVSEKKSLIEKAALLTSERNGLDSRVSDLESQAKLLDSARERFKNEASRQERAAAEKDQQIGEFQKQVDSLTAQVTELEQAKIQLKSQMDKTKEPVEEAMTNSRKRKWDESPTVLFSSWRTAVDDLGDFLHMCKPEMDTDGSCTEEDALKAIGKIAVMESSRDNLLDFFTSSPCDEWYCLDEVAEEGLDAEAAEPCSRHEGGPCLQIRNCNEGKIGGLRYGAFLCRNRS
ncbi:hypothetical protein F4774DRAFT_425146 [Daldinia eschscholtzii]|nr:hypothetical protein F4774DRAFT_425146 [Daldinia eschscholtzii]